MQLEGGLVFLRPRLCNAAALRISHTRVFVLSFAQASLIYGINMYENKLWRVYVPVFNDTLKLFKP